LADETSIYDGKVSLFPGGVVQGLSGSPSFSILNVQKGMVSSINSHVASSVLGDTFNLDSENPKVVINASNVGLTFPWVRNITPVF